MPVNLSDINFTEKNYFKLCKRCFMTGKACIYQKSITENLKSEIKTGFMLMPFQSTLDEVYRAQIEPCLKSILDNVRRADDVSKTGYVICEKICRQIQESRLICAEISCDNPNVFYELGLSFSLDRSIALFIQKSISPLRESLKKTLSLSSDHFNEYDPFEMLHSNSIKLWKKSGTDPVISRNDSVFILLADTNEFTEIVNNQKFSYSVDGLCRGAIHRSLSEMSNLDNSLWNELKCSTVTLKNDSYIEDGKNISFRDVEEKIRNSACVIICTSEEQPVSYFWLGFSHGLEKEVVPITALRPRDSNSKIQFINDKNLTPSNMLPFDMRALWHIYFYCDKPKELENQVNSILDIISNKDKDILHRRSFWQPFFDEGSVSIFVGSVELTINKRHVVGEWDYRTVSELTSFFTSIKETMETVIQTPTFQASTKLNSNDLTESDKYVKELRSKLMIGNSIVLASADVNDMTEVALATYANVTPFSSQLSRHHKFNGVVAFKGQESAAFDTPSLFFQTSNAEDAKGKRGFRDIKGGSIHPNNEYVSNYVSYEVKTDKGYSVYVGHIAKFKVPNSIYWTVILQGITGPATLGLAQVLTGGQHEQFTIFSDTLDKDQRKLYLQKVSEESQSLKSLLESKDTVDLNDLKAHSEIIAKNMTKNFRDKDSVETIIKVYTLDGGDPHHDERRIIWWDTWMPPREMATPTEPLSQ